MESNDYIKLVFNKWYNIAVKDFAKELKSIYEDIPEDVDISVKNIRSDIDRVLSVLIRGDKQ